MYAELVWGIAYNLYIPYASLYMAGVGLTDSQIGAVTTINLVVQTISAFLGGAITDKLGRRLVTALSDLIAWATPCLIWAISQNVDYFIAAAILNGLFKAAMSSWTCLMVEDTDPDILVDMYSWIYVFALTTALISPVTGWLIDKYGLVPAMRVVYIISFILFFIKTAYLFLSSSETVRGKERIEETRNQSLFSILGEYKGVLRLLLQTPQTLYTLGLMTVMGITSTITNTFWGIIAVEKIHIPEAHIAFFPFLRSIVMLIFFFGVLPRINHIPFKRPLLTGFITFLIGQIILVSVPEKNYALLIISVAFDALSVAIVYPQVDKLSVVTVDADERARITSLLFAGAFLIAAPFGWIAGNLSAIDKALPFYLNIGFYALGLVFTLLAARQKEKMEAASI